MLQHFPPVVLWEHPAFGIMNDFRKMEATRKANVKLGIFIFFLHLFFCHLKNTLATGFKFLKQHRVWSASTNTLMSKITDRYKDGLKLPLIKVYNPPIFFSRTGFRHYVNAGDVAQVNHHWTIFLWHFSCTCAVTLVI